MRVAGLVVVAVWVVGECAGFACPRGCACHSDLIICSCQQLGEDHLTLQPFHNIEYISKIYIHSCASLHIPADTFASLAIGEELALTGIRNLSMAPYSFRELDAYPRQMQFRDLAIPRLNPLTFAGLNNAQHIWFRNTTIGTIAAKAFAQTALVEYVYFRETRIKKIEAGAFAGMSEIGHLFFRGSARIDEMEDHIFLGSTFLKQIVFEDAVIETANALAFSGIGAFKLLRFHNCSLPATTYARPNLTLTRTGGGETMEVTDTAWKTLSLGAFSNLRSATFRSSQIHEILLSGDEPLVNVASLRFEHCHIGIISGNAFSGAKALGSVVWVDSTLDSISTGAFHSASLGDLKFSRTRIRRVKEHAFSKLNASGTVELERVRVDRVHHNAFSGLSATRFLVQDCEIQSLGPKAFAGLRTAYFGLERNQIGNLSGLALSGVHAGTANLSLNTIQDYGEMSLAGLYAETRVLNHNTFRCHCDRTYQQLFAMMKDEHFGDEWKFGPAFCLTETNLTIPMWKFLSVCTKASQRPILMELSGGLSCEQKGTLLYCACQSLHEIHLEQASLNSWAPMTGSVAVENCERLTLGSAFLSSLPHLTSLRLSTRHLTISPTAFARLPNFRKLRIHKAELDSLPSRAFEDVVSLELVEFVEVVINRVERRVFSHSRVQNLRFHKAQIGLVQTAFLDADSGTRVERLELSSSRVEVMETGAFLPGALGLLNITQSSLRHLDPGVVGGDGARLCLHSSLLSCSCESAPGLASLLRLPNHCPSGSNQCQRAASISSLTLPDFLREKAQWTLTGCRPLQAPAAPRTSRAPSPLVPTLALLLLPTLRSLTSPSQALT